MIATQYDMTATYYPNKSMIWDKYSDNHSGRWNTQNISKVS